MRVYIQFTSRHNQNEQVKIREKNTYSLCRRQSNKSHKTANWKVSIYPFCGQSRTFHERIGGSENTVRYRFESIQSVKEMSWIRALVRANSSGGRWLTEKFESIRAAAQHNVYCECTAPDEYTFACLPHNAITTGAGV